MIELLTDKNPEERADIKATEIAKLDLVGKYTDLKSGLTIDIQKVSKINEGIEILAKAWKDGKQLGFGDGTVEIERFRIFNPPILVPDGTTHTEIDPNGNEVQRDNFKEDLAEATRQILTHNISLVGNDSSSIISGKIGNTTDTFFPIAGDDSIFALDTTWALVHGATTGTLRGAGTTGYNQAYDGGVNYVMERYFANFTTSAIGTDVISSATLSVWGLENPGTPERTSKVYDSTASTTIAAGDFDLGGTTLWSSGSLVRSTLSIGAYNDMAFNATGLAGINKSGDTKLCIRDTADVSDTDPGDEVDDPYISWSKSNTTGTTQDPKLVVVHAATVVSTGSPQVGFMNLLGIGN